MSSSVCAAETKSASNCDGARNTPRSSICVKERGEAARVRALGVGVIRAPARAQKKSVSSEPTRVRLVAGTPVSRERRHECRRPGGCSSLRALRKIRARRAIRASRCPRASPADCRKRSRLIDRAERRDALHQVRAPAVRGHRQAAADDLAERGQVRLDAEQRLRAAEAQAGSR